jgi:hypothetical protein
LQDAEVETRLERIKLYLKLIFIATGILLVAQTVLASMSQFGKTENIWTNYLYWFSNDGLFCLQLGLIAMSVQLFIKLRALFKYS